MQSHEQQVLQKHYDELVSTLSRSIDEVLRGLVSMRVITITDKNKIKKYGDIPEDRAEYLLDNYIDRLLAARINDNLMKLLHVMKKIPQCKPLAVLVEKELTGAPTVVPKVTHDDDAEIDELIEKFKNEKITPLRLEIEKLCEQGTRQIERYVVSRS